MSKKEQQIYDLMAAIRKSTQPSSGINTFENLLKEIQDTPIFNVFVADMNDFIAEFKVLEKNVDMMENLTLKSKILTYDFIEPKRNFVKSYRAMLLAMKELNRYNTGFGENRTFDLGKRNILGVLPSFTDDSVKHKYAVKYECSDDEKNEIYEALRKVFLLWNYMPAMVKAIIMTKRRSLGLDQNSKKFTNG